MFACHIKRTLPDMIHNINIYKYAKKFGNINFKVDGNNAILNYIEMKEKNKGYGSQFLRLFENYNKQAYNIKNFHLLIKKNPHNNLVLNFFQKNGYNYCNKENNLQFSFFKDDNDRNDLHIMYKISV